MKRLLSVFALAGSLAACDGPAGGIVAPEGTATPTTSATATAEATEEAESRHGNGARSVSEETDDFLFEYAYPAEAGRIPELAKILDRRLDTRRARLAAQSQEARDDAREKGFPYNKHSYSGEWKVVADLPKWLSLSLDMATYSGGAHGNYGVESLVWNKEQGRAINAKDLFTSPAALEQALGDRFCDALDRQRAEKRREPVERDADEEFNRCPRIDELTVLVGSSNGRTFNRLTLYAGPYVAGPYAEGAYEIGLPIDRAVLDTVKPEYREAFSARN